MYKATDISPQQILLYLCNLELDFFNFKFINSVLLDYIFKHWNIKGLHHHIAKKKGLENKCWMEVLKLKYQSFIPSDCKDKGLENKSLMEVNSLFEIEI